MLPRKFTSFPDFSFHPLWLVLMVAVFGPSVLRAQNQTYITTVTTQQTGNVFPGMSNAAILRVNIQMSGAVNARKLNRIAFHTSGTSNTADLLEARLYYTGSQDMAGLPFKLTDTVGRPVKTPSGSIGFAAAEYLKTGNNYFYLVYDISNSAKLSNAIDARLDTVIVADTLRSSAASNPLGNRPVGTYNSYTYCFGGVLYPNSWGSTLIGLGTVVIGDSINNRSNDLDAMTFYPAQKANARQQETIQVKITAGVANNEQIVGWVDWNLDGVYDASTEQMIYSGFTASNTTFKTSFQVPCTQLGTHRLRVVSDFVGSLKPTPCKMLDYGDAEEYLINVQQDVTPVAKFETDTGNYVASVVTFPNTSVYGGIVTFDWDYNNDGTYDAFNTPVGRATYGSTGWKKIRLRLTHQACGGTVTSTYLDSIFVKTAPSAPISNFIADRNVVSTGDDVNLTDISLYKPNAWQWSVSPSVLGGNSTFSFRNGTNASSQNPVIQFSQPGKYTITLTTWNARGKGTTEMKGSYIFVAAPTRMCQVALNSTDTVRADNGFLFDEGGAGAYFNAGAGTQRTCRMVLKPECGTDLTLNFKVFNLNNLVSTTMPAGSTGDNLKIWDGTNSSGKALHTAAGFANGFTNGAGNGPVMPPQLKSSTGAFYIEYSVNDAFIGDGFEAYWETKPSKIPAPRASFTAPDTVWVERFFTLTNTSTGFQNTYEWDMDDDGLSEQFGKDMAFIYFMPGAQKVRLIARNCSGADTAFGTIYVKMPKVRPQANFKADAYQASVGDIVQLTDLSTEGPSNWKWKITTTNPKAAVSFAVGSATAQNPGIRFSDSTWASVELVATNLLGSDSLLKKFYIRIRPVCKPGVTNLNTDVGMSAVTLASKDGTKLINNTSDVGTEAYTLYAGPPVPYLQKGDSFTFSASRITSLNALDGRVWLDLNQDGDFDDAGELVVSQNNIRGTTWGGKFKIPATGTASGYTRLRVGVNAFGVAVKPCGTNQNGEFEDYVVNVGVDNTAPVITLNGGDTVLLEEARPYTDLGAKAFDNIDGDITASIKVTNPVNPYIFKTYFVTYNVTDAAGNKAKPVVRVVKMIPDTTRPVITLKGADSVAVAVFGTWADPGADADDNSSGQFTPDVTGSVDLNKVGVYVLTYTAVDYIGNTTVINRKVYVIDTILPVVKLKGGDTLRQQINTPFSDPGLDITDNYYTSFSIVTSGQVDISKMGNYPVTYSVTDGSGNGPLNVTRIVRVDDYIKPTFKLGSDSIYWDVRKPFVAPANVLQYWDNFYSFDKLTLKSIGSVDVNKLGKQTIRYYVTDASGNRSDTLSLKVIVEDTERPHIELIGNFLIHHDRWKKFSDPSVAVSDNFDKNVQIVLGGDFNDSLSILRPGTYLRTYQAIDQSGNRSELLNRIIVVEQSISGIEDAVPGKLNISLYPNPARTQVYISLSLKERKQVAVMITDLLGRPVMDVWSGSTDGQQLNADISTLPAGVYHVRCVVDGVAVTKSLVVVK